MCDCGCKTEEELERERLRFEVCSVQGHIQPVLNLMDGYGFSRCGRCEFELVAYLPKGKLIEWDLFNIELLQLVLSEANDIFNGLSFVPMNR